MIFYQKNEKLTEDITKLLNMPSIDEIKEKSLLESKYPDAVYLYDDDKYLLIAINYTGIRKYGSSYWCIYEDEGTFDSYVTDENNIQCILYVRGKNPLVDDHSIMGVTMNYEKRIDAAHWEDDSECLSDANKIINGSDIYNRRGRRGGKGESPSGTPLPIPMKNILKAYETLYGYDKSDLSDLIFKIPEIYIDKINQSFEGYKDGYPTKISNLMESYISYLNEMYDRDDATDAMSGGFYKLIKKSLIERNLKIRIELKDVILYDLSDVCQFQSEWLSYYLYEYMDECEVDMDDTGTILKMFKFFKKNGYDAKKDITFDGDDVREDLVDLLINNDILDFSEYYKLARLSKISDKNLRWVIENDFDYIMLYTYIFKKAIKYIDSKNLIEKYRSKLIDHIQKGNITNEMCEIIVDEVDDVEVAITAARRILPPKLLKRFKFEISKLEHLQKFKEFNIYKS